MLTLHANPTRDEALIVAKNIRIVEKEEMDKFMKSPAFFILESVEESRYVFSIRDEEGTPIALTGIGDMHEVDPGTSGIVWLICTEAVQDNAISFYRIIRDLIQSYGHLYDRLFNFVDDTCDDHKRFIDSIGFSITDKVYSDPDIDVTYTMFEYWSPKGLNKMFMMEADNE